MLCVKELTFHNSLAATFSVQCIVFAMSDGLVISTFPTRLSDNYIMSFSYSPVSGMFFYNQIILFLKRPSCSLQLDDQLLIIGLPISPESFHQRSVKVVHIIDICAVIRGFEFYTRSTLVLSRALGTRLYSKRKH